MPTKNDNIGPAFEPDDLTAGLLHADYLEMAVCLCDGFDGAEEVIIVAAFHFKPGTPQELWRDYVQWFIDRAYGLDGVRVCEADGDEVAYVATVSEALDYIARTRLLREEAETLED